MQGPEVTAIPEAKSWCGFRGVWAKGGSGLEPPQLGVLLGHTLRRADSTFAVINPHGEKRLFPSPVLTHILTPAQRQLPRTGQALGGAGSLEGPQTAFLKCLVWPRRLGVDTT